VTITIAGDEVAADRVRDRVGVCRQFGAQYLMSPDNGRIGLSRTFSLDDMPVHGLRHPPEFGETGWYFWTGELSEAPDFFAPEFTAAIILAAPFAERFLGLAPGWRVLLTPDHVDVWYDEQLLNI
jgi:hypothetical protein